MSDRSAADTIRGFLSQAYWTVDRWLDLGEGERLVCEGREDLDKTFFDQDGRFISVREQMKDLASNISARTEDVYETIFNFLLAFHEAHVEGAVVRFVFTTSASLADQQTGPGKSPVKKRANLPINVLATWSKLDIARPDPESVASLEQSIRELTAYYGKPSDADGKPADHRHSRETLETTVAYLSKHALWDAFFRAVQWNPEQIAGAELVKNLEAKLATDKRAAALPAGILLQRLLAVVLHTASTKDAARRVLLSASLEEVTTTTADELRAWAAEHRSELAAAWLLELEDAVADLKRDVAALTEATSPRAQILTNSERVKATLEDSLHFAFQGTNISLVRPVVDRMCSMARTGSMLVVGDAGAGKSGALAALVRKLQSDGSEVVCLAANNLLPERLGTVLPGVLADWSEGTEGGFLVVDALDTERGDAGAAEVRQTLKLVRERCPNWNVIASVRTYDLSSRSSLAAAFAGEPDDEFQNRQFRLSRHICVPALGDDELAQLLNSSPVLAEILAGADPPVRDLLRNLFNLAVAAKLLDSGIGVDELRSVHSQVGLLELYWNHRVGTPSSEKHAREDLLRNMVDVMLGDATLRVARRDIPVAGLSKALDDLLSASVLIHPRHSNEAVDDDSFLEFFHNILFDYAGARVWLDPRAARLAAQLEAYPDLPFIARPSLTMYFQRVWESDHTRARFWDHAVTLEASNARSIAKVLPAGVASQLARELSDFEPLLEIATKAGRHQEPAAAVLHHVIGAAQMNEPVNIVGANGGPWCALCRSVSASTDRTMMEATRRLLHFFNQSTSTPTTAQLSDAGHAARNYLTTLRAAWSHNTDAIAQGVGFVARTFASSPADAEALLRSEITPQALAERGFQTVRYLANQLHHVILVAPEFATEVYDSVFAYRETSQTRTALRGGVMGLVSHRRQDYEGGLRTLSHAAYERLCSADLSQATRSLARVLNHLSRERVPVVEHEMGPEPFDFQGRVAHIIEDPSPHFFDVSHRRDDDDVAMVETWEAAIRAVVSGGASTAGRIPGILDVVAEENQTALLWTRVLKLGVEYPRDIGVHLGELLRAGPILHSMGTSTDAAEAIRVIHPHLVLREQALIEEAILSVSHVRTRERLLASLDAIPCATQAARDALNDLRKKGAMPKNTPPVRFSSMRAVDEPQYEWLRAEGVEIDLPDNRAVLDEVERVEEATNANQEDVSKIGPLQLLADVLERHPDVHTSVQRIAQTTIATGCRRLADALASSNDEGAESILIHLLSAANAEMEGDEPPSVEGFDSAPSLTSTPRMEAALALAGLLRFAPLATREVVETVERLSADRSPAVRYQVASRLEYVHLTQPDLARRILVSGAREEPSIVIKARLVALSPRLLPARMAAEIAAELLDPTAGGDPARLLRDACVDVLAKLHIYEDEPRAGDAIVRLLQMPECPAAGQLALWMRRELTHGDPDQPDLKADQARSRAVTMATNLAGAARRALESRLDDRNGRPEEVRDEPDVEIGALWRLLDKMGFEVLFASGSYDEKNANKPEHRRARLGVSHRRRFYSETRGLLDQLAEVPIPSVSHHVLETLEHLIPLDPLDAIARIGELVTKAAKGGYQYDSFGIETIAGIVEIYLADHMALLRENAESRRAILDSLDVFVQAGWPAGLRLVHRLHEVFR